MKKNLIVAVCGDESLHRIWLGGKQDFDLFVVYYGDAQGKYKEDGLYYDQAKGTKFLIMHEMVQKHAHIFEEYDAIAIPDDDLYITSSDWSRFFDLFHRYEMQLAQPAIYGWQATTLTATNPEYVVRYTNWVEIMTPCFTQHTFQAMKETFNENSTNWGIDFLWVKLLGNPKTGVGIIDDVTAIHTRPCFFGDTYWRNNNNCDKAIHEIEQVGEKYDINLQDLLVYGGVKRTKREYDNQPSEDKFFPFNCEIMKELIESLRKRKHRTLI